MKKPPKVIFIDWNKTLSNSLFWEHLSDTSHLLNKHHSKIIKSLIIKSKSEVSAWMRGQFSTKDILNLIKKDTHIKYKTLYRELQKSCENMTYVSPKIPDLIRKIQCKGIKVVIATDNMDTFSNFTVPSLGLDSLFDEILNSFDLKVLKEDFDKKGTPIFFKKFMTENNLTYDEVVLLDDNLDETGNYDRLGFKIKEITSKEKLIRILEYYGTKSLN